MPLLEHRRRTYQTDSITHFFVSLLDHCTNIISHLYFSIGRYWALCWAIFHISGYAAGSTIYSWEGIGNFALLSRLSCLLPICFGFLHRKWIPIIWILVFSLSFLAGTQESFHRHERIAVAAPSAWEPSFEISVEGIGIFKPTAWAKTGANNYWQVPAVLLAWNPKENDTMSPINKPQIGQGIMISGKGDIPTPGEVIGASLVVKVPAISSLPGIFDDRKYLQGRTIRWRAKCIEASVLTNSKNLIPGIFYGLGKIRRSIIGRIESGIPHPESDLMMAVLMGVRTPTTRGASQPFSRLGLSHLFAVSGLHVGIIMGILLLPLSFFQLQPEWRLLPAILFLPVYILLTGAPGSVVRAAGMTILLLLTMPLGRKSHSLQLLGLLFWAGIIWQPYQILDTGMRLSYLATGGIISVVGFVNKSESLFWRNRWGKVTLGLIVSLAANWFTLPQVASSFGYISGFSPIANLITVPLFGLAVWSLVLGLGFECVAPFIGQSLLSWTWLIVRFLSGILGKISSVVHPLNMTFPNPNFLDVLFWISGTIFLLIFLRIWSAGRSNNKVMSTMVFLIFGLVIVQFQSGSLGASNSRNIQVWQFDVGQGDCSLIIFPDRWCGVIDTGGVVGFNSSSGNKIFERKVDPWLKRQHIKEIAAIVLSHGHLDHTAGTEFLISEYSVRSVYTGGRAKTPSVVGSPSPKIQYPSAGEILHQWEDWELSFVQPDTNQTAHLHENDKSLVVVLKKRDTVQMVWTGDMEEHEEHLLMETPYMPSNAVVLKAGHHGSNTSSSQQFIDQMKPQVVIISCGVGNRYHHPSHGPFLANGDTIPVLRTDLHGSVHLAWDREGNLRYEAGKIKGFLPKS